MLAFTAAALLTPLERVERPLLLVDDGKVVEVALRGAREAPGHARLVDFGDATLAPAFIDMHIHGGGGYDVMQPGAGGLARIEQFLASKGVSSYFPTTVTAPADTLCAALDGLASAIEAAGPAADGSAGNHGADGARARPLGIHLEGPFISHARRGVHPPADLLPPTLAMFERFWQAARGHIAIMTIAPELEGAMEVITEAVRRGACVSIGHSDANYTAARSAVDAGARHATHTFNAMRPLDHRDPGILGEVLTDPRMSAEIIADGIHLKPAIVDLFMRCKGPDAAVLVTDAIAATGMPNGAYRLGSLSVEVKDGVCLAEGRLAGSVLTLDRAVRNLMEFTGCDLQSAVRAATVNPARRLGLAGRKGELAPGADADIVVLSERGDLRQTIVGGRLG